MATTETAWDTCAAAGRTFGLTTGKPPRLISTGFAAVDDAIGGVVAGCGCIVAARTGVGKSSIVLDAVVSDRETRTGWISLEDGRDVIGPRIMAKLARVNALEIRRGECSEADRARAVRAIAKAARIPILFSYQLGAGVADVVEAIEELARQGCERIVVDHLHRLRGGSDASRTADVAGAHARLLAAFAATGTAGIVIAQVRRAQRDKRGRLPRLSIHDLKDSGDLENDARLILLVDRLDDDTIEVSIGKSTVGGEGLSWRYARDARGNLKELE